MGRIDSQSQSGHSEVGDLLGFLLLSLALSATARGPSLELGGSLALLSGREGNKRRNQILSNVNIREAIASGQLAIENLQDKAIQPASIDLHLSPVFILANRVSHAVDPYLAPDVTEAFSDAYNYTGDRYILWPGHFVLAATERVTLGNELVGQVAGKSSLARLGLYVESAGFIDPGFDGPITLELYNVSPNSILLTPSMPICQLSLSRLDSPASPVYSGSYVNSSGPVISRYWKSNKRPGAGA
jgi:dCTP deaminase